MWFLHQIAPTNLPVLSFWLPTTWQLWLNSSVEFLFSSLEVILTLITILKSIVNFFLQLLLKLTKNCFDVSTINMNTIFNLLRLTKLHWTVFLVSIFFKINLHESSIIFSYSLLNFNRVSQIKTLARCHVNRKWTINCNKRNNLWVWLNYKN